jgi:uncharacterized membrane protein
MAAGGNAMGVASAIVGLWVAFAVTHMVPSSPRVRSRLVGALGERAFMASYSLVSLALFVPLVWVYLEHRHVGPQLWEFHPGTLLLWILDVLMGIALVLIVGGVVQPSPASIAGPSSTELRGVHRLTRHPVFMGLGLIGLLHLIPQGHASDVAFFGGLPLFAIIGCLHQDQRKLETGGEAFRLWYEKTPFLPFTGPETWRGIRDLGAVTLAVGIGLTVVLRLLHGPLFG